MMKNEAGLFEVNVEGEKYEFEKWGADEALDVLTDLTAIMGKPLSMGASAFLKKDGDEDSEGDSLKMIGMIMEALSGSVGANKATIKMLVKKFSSEKVFCNGAKINFNLHYQDRLGHLFQVVKAGLEVQFGNFFGDLLGKAGLKRPGIANRQV